LSFQFHGSSGGRMDSEIRRRNTHAYNTGPVGKPEAQR
jgi:hypothetical protein